MSTLNVSETNLKVILESIAKWSNSDRRAVFGSCERLGKTLHQELNFLCSHFLIVKSHTRLRMLSMMPVSCQAACRWLSHKPGGRLPLLFTRPAVTFPTTEITPLAGTKLYRVVTEAHGCK